MWTRLTSHGRAPWIIAIIVVLLGFSGWQRWNWDVEGAGQAPGQVVKAAGGVHPVDRTKAPRPSPSNATAGNDGELFGDDDFSVEQNGTDVSPSPSIATPSSAAAVASASAVPDVTATASVTPNAAASATPTTSGSAPPAPLPTNPAVKGRFDTAFVTYVMGEIHSRQAVVLMKSLRDSGSADSSQLLVLVGHGPKGGAECEANSSVHGYCVREDAPIEDLMGWTYIRAFREMNVELRLAGLVPRSPYTEGIAGGPYAFWGSAFNKIQVLKLTEFKRVVWMDSDTMALQSLAHLMGPEVETGPEAFTAAFTLNCCAGVRGKLGGSLWVFEPSMALYERVLHTANTPSPWGGETGVWSDGDQQIIAFTVGIPLLDKRYLIEYWPFLEDYRQGLAPGFQYLPQHRGWTREQVQAELNWNIKNRFPPALYGPNYTFVYKEGLLPKSDWPRDPGPEFRGSNVSIYGDTGPGVPVWHPLDARYDIMVGNCGCMPQHDLAGRIEQDSVGMQMTAHFSCLQPPLRKPGEYESEAAFMEAVYKGLSSCQRYYYLHWYDTYKRAVPGGFPAPAYTGPPVPGIDVTHDQQVVHAARRIEEERRLAALDRQADGVMSSEAARRQLMQVAIDESR